MPSASKYRAACRRDGSRPSIVLPEWVLRCIARYRPISSAHLESAMTVSVVTAIRDSRPGVPGFLGVLLRHLPRARTRLYASVHSVSWAFLITFAQVRGSKESHYSDACIRT